MKIVITGGNGYIGARLSLYLAERGHEIIPVCFPSVPGNIEWTTKMFSILTGDLRKDDIYKKIKELCPDVIIHLVSLDHFESEKAPKYVSEINLLPTWRLLDLCSKNELKKFIYFSTIQVYGKLPVSDINENHPVSTSNIYGLTHYLSENICDHFNRISPTNVMTVRLSNSYGAPVFADNNCWWLAINDLCKSAFLKKEIRLLSDGSPQRDFIHGNDVCQAVDLLINSGEKQKDNIYHISSGVTLTILEIAQIIQEEYKLLFNVSLPIITPNGVVDQFTSPHEIEKYEIKNARLKAIGFSQKITIKAGINELFQYLKREK